MGHLLSSPSGPSPTPVPQPSPVSRPLGLGAPGFLGQPSPVIPTPRWDSNNGNLFSHRSGDLKSTTKVWEVHAASEGSSRCPSSGLQAPSAVAPHCRLRLCWKAAFPAFLSLCRGLSCDEGVGLRFLAHPIQCGAVVSTGSRLSRPLVQIKPRSRSSRQTRTGPGAGVAFDPDQRGESPELQRVRSDSCTSS